MVLIDEAQQENGDVVIYLQGLGVMLAFPVHQPLQVGIEQRKIFLLFFLYSFLDDSLDLDVLN